ncbi:hypothetical protein N7509_002483 [Penicillium cosmopolitanum]|uniref:Uncharacterized protein n=1 Tax=Penicillium cosmopolitanum TaxID=1131564 RepID=A0A9X0BDH3_9EURO|nr:uncharacterized protein N7509_002483 [Penicillium cosmopolitanum]KAJ5408600.1 hypothetical protein N7509_002483 [Penicillium cosmopolitanum]
MRSAYALSPLAAAIGAVASQPADSWVFGNSLFYLGPPSGNSHITKATYSIVPPSVPSGAKSNADDEPWVSVWVGASSTAGDQDANLYQPIFNWCPDQESQGCPATAQEWCVAASTYTPSGQLGQAYVTVPKSTQVDFEIAVVNSKVVQTVTMNDKIISKESDALDAPLQYLYSSNECYTGAGSCGSVDGWKITNLTVTLSEADTSFDSVMSLDSVTDAEFKSTDGGITWHTDRITVNTIDFDSSDDTQVQ